MIDFIKGSAKAWLAAALALVSFLGPVVDDGLKASEGLAAVGVFITAFIGVYFVENTGPNAPDSGTPANADAQEQPPLW